MKAAVLPAVAFIDENLCIGCALCLPACPVDAIVGAPRFMHTVIVDDCIGCKLCIAPCPVDCIDMRRVERESIPAPTEWKARVRRRYQAHTTRLAQTAAERRRRLKEMRSALRGGTP